MTDVLQVIGTATGIAGAFLVSFKKVWVAQMVWFVGNSCWIAYGVMASNWYLVVLFGVYLVTTIIGLMNFRPKSSKE